MAKTQFPQIPVIRTADPQQTKFNAAVREALAMMTGTKADRVLTLRDISGGALKGLTLTGAVVDQSAQPGAGGTGPVQRPTAPTGVKANAGMQSVFFQWDLPSYSGHAYTEVYRFDADSLALAQPVAKVVYVLFSEFVGSNKTYWYWLRHVNVNGVAGPWNATAGTRVQTAIDVDEVLRSLSNKITESQFAQGLLSRINLIDGGGDGGLVQQLAEVESTLQAADARLSLADYVLGQQVIAVDQKVEQAQT
ncbi:MAG: hypothetical protein K2W88_15910, partial [Pararheinheimera sp.]|nr:hypothetical protein [Rheinheimera sp.]